MRQQPGGTGAQDGDPFAAVHDELTDGRELRFAHRLIEQRIGLPSGILRLHVIRGLEIDRIDFRQPDERRTLHIG